MGEGRGGKGGGGGRMGGGKGNIELLQGPEKRGKNLNNRESIPRKKVLSMMNTPLNGGDEQSKKEG